MSMDSMFQRILRFLKTLPLKILFLTVLILCLTVKTYHDLQPISLDREGSSVQRSQFVDRSGKPLSYTYENNWNIHDVVPLHDIPMFLQSAFIVAEDKRFFSHHGVDVLAITHAMLQNIRAMRVVRGGSTITQQVVRLLHPRPRTIWSRWLEIWEAQSLETTHNKNEILEFYLNQVPYARERRGIRQASRLYFDRDLDTLNAKEMLALVVMVRAPSKLEPFRDRSRLEERISHLGSTMLEKQFISDADLHLLQNSLLNLRQAELSVDASHFLRSVAISNIADAQIRTTLDSHLQQKAQALLQGRVEALREKNVTHGAILVLQNQSGEVLVWANSDSILKKSSLQKSERQTSQIDAVITPRQPGSTLKPFLYALALQYGWTAATLIEDSPLQKPVGAGLYRYRNYSGEHYGLRRVREALGNSLNIPGIKTIDFVGVKNFYEFLHALGFDSLNKGYDFYGEGLALGNGEVTLLELVQGYRVLANRGEYRPVVTSLHRPGLQQGSRRVLSPEITSLIANILSDKYARLLEFGSGNLLDFPVQTAVKTGTSSDYRDAWAVGFSDRFTVGVWLGNLDARPMQEVSGSIGAAVILRAMFKELEADGKGKTLFVDPKLAEHSICALTGELASPHCPTLKEWFLPNSQPQHTCRAHQELVAQTQPSTPNGNNGTALSLTLPSPGLHLALDPRVPVSLQAFPLTLPPNLNPSEVHWYVDNKIIGTTGPKEIQFLWPIKRGHHEAFAEVYMPNQKSPLRTKLRTKTVGFLVN